MNKKLITLLVAVAMLVVMVAGCGGETKPSPAASVNPGTSTDPTEKTPDKIADKIVIGFSGALTGGSASMGGAVEHGAKEAVADINAAGGILGAEVVFISKDDAADPATNQTNVEELVLKDNATFILGSPNSACASQSVCKIPFREKDSFILHRCYKLKHY